MCKGHYEDTQVVYLYRALSLGVVACSPVFECQHVHLVYFYPGWELVMLELHGSMCGRSASYYLRA